jgi:hypothetical protein
MKTLILSLVLFASQHAPLPPHSEIVKRPIFCGPMYTPDGDLDHDTALCVGRALGSGRKAYVGAFCRNGEAVLILVWMNDAGEVDMQKYEDVCPADAPPDMAVPQKKGAK